MPEGALNEIHVLEVGHFLAGPFCTTMVRAGPLLGEHSAEVLEETGYSQEEIRRLAEAGVIRTA
jgi:crotonobetainyl-CoA:carnitine CoA-transferase CaiB-like acyl-CoA transferase